MSSIEADATGSNAPGDAGIAAVRASGMSGASGVIATSEGGYGLSATSTSGIAISATSTSAPGAILNSQKATTVIVVTGDYFAQSSEESLTWRAGHAIVAATGVPDAAGLFAKSGSGPGVSASSINGAGVIAQSMNGAGIMAVSEDGPGARISSQQATGIIVSTGSTPPPPASPISLFGAANSLEQSLESAGHAILATTNIQDAAGLYAQSLTGTGGVVSGGKVALDASSSNGIGVRAHSDSGVALQVEGQLHVHGSAVGQVTTSGGETLLQVETTAVTAQSTVLLTPLDNPGALLWVKSREPGEFLIAASLPLPPQLTIQYLVIN